MTKYFVTIIAVALFSSVAVADDFDNTAEDISKTEHKSKVKFGKKCTLADNKQIQETSWVWLVSSEALPTFDKRINKKNCLKG